MKRFFTCSLVIAMMGICTGGVSVAKQPQKAAPNFRLKDLNQGQVELSSFKGKKPVVLFFWTTWCPYCLRELKHMNSLAEQLNKQGIELLAINSG
jgi:peroxiredoxin